MLLTIISSFPRMFSALSRTQVIILTYLEFSSADTFNLDQSTILSSAKGLKSICRSMLYQYGSNNFLQDTQRWCEREKIVETVLFSNFFTLFSDLEVFIDRWPGSFIIHETMCLIQLIYKIISIVSLVGLRNKEVSM